MVQLPVMSNPLLLALLSASSGSTSGFGTGQRARTSTSLSTSTRSTNLYYSCLHSEMKSIKLYLHEELWVTRSQMESAWELRLFLGLVEGSPARGSSAAHSLRQEVRMVAKQSVCSWSNTGVVVCCSWFIFSWLRSLLEYSLPGFVQERQLLIA